MHPWIAKYYPDNARDLFPNHRAGDNVTDEMNLKAIDHSLQKWEGLLPEALAEFDVTLEYGTVEKRDGTPLLGIDGSSCALCRIHIDWLRPSCEKCPLWEVRGGAACDRKTAGELLDDVEAPFGAMRFHGDPKPMIAELKRARVMVLRKIEGA